MSTLTELNVHPLKSASGMSVESASLTPKGLLYDREFMLVDADGVLMTRREHNRMALLKVGYDGARLVVNDFIHSPVDNGPVHETKVWRDPCQGIDQGDEASAYFSDFLGVQCRLLHFTGHRATEGGGETSFADAFPLLIISQESLDELNTRLDEPVPMNRFRPNLVLEGLGPFSEDKIAKLQVGDQIIDLVKPCPRCVMTTVDAETAVKGREPLRTLATYRTQVWNGDRGIMFGQNAVPRTTGTLHVGDPVEILEYKA